MSSIQEKELAMLRRILNGEEEIPDEVKHQVKKQEEEGGLIEVEIYEEDEFFYSIGDGETGTENSSEYNPAYTPSEWQSRLQ